MAIKSKFPSFEVLCKLVGEMGGIKDESRTGCNLKGIRSRYFELCWVSVAVFENWHDGQVSGIRIGTDYKDPMPKDEVRKLLADMKAEFKSPMTVDPLYNTILDILEEGKLPLRSE